jgi:nucleoside-diphosphate kinase
MSVTVPGSLGSLRGLAARCQPSGSASALPALASNTARATSAASKAVHLSSRAISTADKSQDLELTLALIKPSVCSYQPDVSAILKEIKQSGLNVRPSRLLLLRRSSWVLTT